MRRVVESLKKYGPMLSGNLAAILEREYLISNETARKAISRSRTPVQKLKVFLFNKNQVYVYLEEQFNTQRYRERLYEALKKEALSVAVILYSLENNNYIMKKRMLPIYSKSPIENTKGHRNFDRVISDLINQGVIFEVDDEYYAVSPMYCGEEYNLTYSKSGEQILKIVAEDFVSWATKLNIIAYNSVRIYPAEATFAHFRWFATAPSYVAPLYDLERMKPGFVVVDVILKSKASIQDVSFFVEKIKIIRNFKGVPAFVPVLLVNGVNSETLQYLKENKVVIGVLSNLFDKKYVETLMNMYNVLRNATAVILKEPQKLEELIREIAKNEGRFNNAMGDLFECMVGLFYIKLGSRYVELNKQVSNGKGGKYEIDVLVEREGKILIVECKAYRGKVDKEYIEKWLSSRIPVFRKFIEQIYHGRKIEFSIWSLGGFDKYALELLDKHKSMVKRYEISYLSKKEIYRHAQDCNDKLFCEQINKHFKEYGETIL